MVASQFGRIALASITCAILLVACVSGSEFKDSEQQVVDSYAAARNWVDQHWFFSRSLQCRDPTKHGLVEKKASMIDSATMRLGIGSTQAFVESRVPIYAGCQVFVSHKYKFIYIRTPKSASSAILIAMRKDVCGGRECTSEELSKVDPKGEPLSNEIWADYFVFTIIRNPWSRMISAFNFLTKRHLMLRPGQSQLAPTKPCAGSFELFSQDSNHLRSICPKERCCAYVQGHGFVPAFVDEHINDQSHCVFLSNGDATVDFVARAERLNEDWPVILQHINRRAGSSLQSAGVAVQNRSGPNACEEMSGVLDNFSEAEMHGIASQYAMDMMRYGYLPEAI